jgi:hypothetical protein
MLMRHWLAITLACVISLLAVAAGTILLWHPIGAIIRQCPSRRVCDFADTVRVENSRNVREEPDRGGYAMWYLVAAKQDLTTAVSAAGVTLKPPAPRSVGTVEEDVTAGESTMPQWHGCGLLVEWIHPPATAIDWLSTSQKSEVDSGKAKLVSVSLSCDLADI